MNSPRRGSMKRRWLDFDDLMTSQLNAGESFLDFEMLDARIASASRKIISSTSFRGRVGVEEQRAQKYNRFLRGRQIAYMIYGHFQSTGACDTAQGLSDLISFCLQDDDVQDLDTSWDQILLGTSEMPSDNFSKVCTKLIAMFRKTSNSVCNVQSRIESRSGGVELSEN